MLNWMFRGTVASLFVATAFLTAGCGTQSGDDDITPTDTPDTEVTPEPLYFDEASFSKDCTADGWGFDLVNFGWVDGVPELTLFDSPAYPSYGGDYTKVYCEIHTLALVSGSTTFDGTNGQNEQSWARDLDAQADIDAQASDVDTIFPCANKPDMTYRICAYDLEYDQEVCVVTTDSSAYDPSVFETFTCSGDGATRIPPWYKP